jgi:hypothetical protein
MGPRVSLSVLLLACGVVLLAAIAVGNRMGNRVLVQVSHRTESVPTPFFSPPPEEKKDRQVSLSWKRTQLVSVATDPAFPDPRITPVPPPPVRRRPHKPAKPLARKPSPEDMQPGTPIPYATPQR